MTNENFKPGEIAMLEDVKMTKINGMQEFSINTENKIISGEYNLGNPGTIKNLEKSWNNSGIKVNLLGKITGPDHLEIYKCWISGYNCR